MPGVPTAVEVVDHYFDNLIVLEDEGIGRVAVDKGIGGEQASGERGVEGWDFLGRVGLVVDCCSSEGGVSG